MTLAVAGTLAGGLGSLILLSSELAQGPGGYNPIGPGVDLAGYWDLCSMRTHTNEARAQSL